MAIRTNLSDIEKRCLRVVWRANAIGVCPVLDEHFPVLLPAAKQLICEGVFYVVWGRDDDGDDDVERRIPRTLGGGLAFKNREYEAYAEQLIEAHDLTNEDPFG